MLPAHRLLSYLLASFCCGIAVGRHLQFTPLTCIASALFFSALLCWRKRTGRISLFLPLVIFLTIGVLSSRSSPDPDRPPPEIKKLLLNKNAVLMATIASPPRKSPGRTTVRVRLEAVKEGDSWRPVSGNLLLTGRECPQAWSVGQRFIGRIRLRSVHNFNNPGGFDYRQYLADQRIWARGYARRATDLLPLGKPDMNLWESLLNRIRSSSRALLEARLPPDNAALYRALLLGERFALTEELLTLLYNAGLGHLLAVSGLHLGMVAGFAYLLFRFIMLRIPALAERWAAHPCAALASFPVALGYAFLTGLGLPALRATLMLSTLTLGLVIHREKDLLNSLSLAALLILLLRPEALFAASFQLSFMAVFSLVWVLPRLPVPQGLGGQSADKDKWRRSALRLYQFACCSLVLFLFTSPLVLYHFHRLSPVGLFTNLLLVPLVGFLILPAGLAALCLLGLSSALAGFLLTLGGLGLSIVVTVSAKVGASPWASLYPGVPTVWQLALAYFVLLVPFVQLCRWWRVGLLVGGTLVLTGSWILPWNCNPEDSLLRVTCLDVGQGSSAVVEFPGNAAMLIDGGGFQASSFDIGRHVVAPYLWCRRIRCLEAVVLSHAHPDHFKGLHFIAAHFPTKEFWYNGVSAEDPDFIALMSRVAEKNMLRLSPNELPVCREINGVEVRILHPPHASLPGRKIITDKDRNNLSLVLRLSYKEVSFLFPGDIEKEAEVRLTGLPSLQPVDVLMAPHHGSRTSSSLSFLQRLRPRIVVYSVGRNNRFHLPAACVVKRCHILGVRAYRTDRHGAVTISTDGKRIDVETFLDVDNEGSGKGQVEVTDLTCSSPDNS